MAGNENGATRKILPNRSKLQVLLRMEDDKYNYLKLSVNNFTSEMFGTGLLVFLGCMGCVQGLDQHNSHLGIALSFALAVFLSIQICCHNSGGHLNPALTVVSVFFKRLTIPMACIYIVAQCVGGILGFGLLLGITPLTKVDFEPPGLCVTLPHASLSIFQAFLTEFILTSVLMLVVCSIWDPRNGPLHDSATLKFGFAVFSLAYAGVPYSGCSMNPARSLGPAVWNNSWKLHWVFWLGPMLAGLFTGFIYTTFFCGALGKEQNAAKRSTQPLELRNLEAVASVTS